MSQDNPDAMCIRAFWVVEPSRGEYQCPGCGHKFEQDFDLQQDDTSGEYYVDEVVVCPNCDDDAELITDPDIHPDGF